MLNVNNYFCLFSFCTHEISSGLAELYLKAVLSSFLIKMHIRVLDKGDTGMGSQGHVLYILDVCHRWMLPYNPILLCSLFIQNNFFALTSLPHFIIISIGNYMLLSVIWLGNRTRRSLVQFSHFQVQLHPNYTQKHVSIQ